MPVLRAHSNATSRLVNSRGLRSRIPIMAGSDADHRNHNLNASHSPVLVEGSTCEWRTRAGCIDAVSASTMVCRIMPVCARNYPARRPTQRSAFNNINHSHPFELFNDPAIGQTIKLDQTSGKVVSAQFSIALLSALRLTQEKQCALQPLHPWSALAAQSMAAPPQTCASRPQQRPQQASVIQFYTVRLIRITTRRLLQNHVLPIQLHTK